MGHKATLVPLAPKLDPESGKLAAEPGMPSANTQLGSANAPPPYPPLRPEDRSEIRLVKLFPGAFDEPVRCEIEVVSLRLSDLSMWRYDPDALDRTADYAALSHEAPPPRAQRRTLPIEVGGQPCLVSEGLHAFLRHAQAVMFEISTAFPGSDALSDMRESAVLCRLMRDVSKRYLTSADAVRAAVRQSMVDAMQASREESRRRLLGPRSGGQEPGDSDEELQRKAEELLQPREGRHDNPVFLRLWAEELCVDYSDAADVSRHVLKRWDIYKAAREVFIWLGDSALMPAADVISMVDSMEVLVEWWKHRDDSAIAVLEELIGTKIDKVVVTEKASSLLLHPWFRRIWSIQELAAARGRISFWIGFQQIELDLVLGVGLTVLRSLANMACSLQPEIQRVYTHNVVRLRELVDVAKDIVLERQVRAREKRSVSVPTFPERPDRVAGAPDEVVSPEAFGDLMARGLRNTTDLDLVHARRISVGDAAEFYLQQLLGRCGQHFTAMDTRDHIYALLGIIGADRLAEHLQPNYAVPATQVFYWYTVWLLQNARALELVGASSTAVAGVPSWVPDYATLSEGLWLSRCRAVRAPRTSPGDHTGPTARIDRLEVEGVVLGTIVRVMEPSLCRVPLPTRIAPETRITDLKEALGGPVQSFCDVTYGHAQVSHPELGADEWLGRWTRLWAGYIDERDHLILMGAEAAPPDYERTAGETGADGLRAALSEAWHGGLAVLDSGHVVFGHPYRFVAGDSAFLAQGAPAAWVLRSTGPGRTMVVGKLKGMSMGMDPGEEFFRKSKMELMVLE